MCGKLLNEENDWDQGTACVKTEGPMCRISTHEVSSAMEKMKIRKASGPSEEEGIWKRSFLIPVYKIKGECDDSWYRISEYSFDL